MCHLCHLQARQDSRETLNCSFETMTLTLQNDLFSDMSSCYPNFNKVTVMAKHDQELQVPKFKLKLKKILD